MTSPVILSLNQLCYLIEKSGYKWATIYTGEVRNFEEVNPFHTIKGDSTSSLIEELKEFAEVCTTRFTLLLKEAQNTKTENTGRVVVEFKHEIQEAEVLEGLPHAPTRLQETPPIDIEQLRKDVKADLLVEMENTLEKETLKRDIRALEIERKQIEEPAEKISLVLEKLAVRLFPSQVAATEVQGTTDGDYEAIDEAIDYLRKTLGDGTLISIAQKVKADPKLIQTIKSMLT